MSTQDLKSLEEWPGYAEFLLFLEEEKVSESDPHSSLIRYLMAVLDWLYRVTGWYHNTDMGIFQPGYYPVSPDVALFKGLVLSEEERASLTSWALVLPNRPSPTVVFEVASEKTWREDVEADKKPLRYKQMGVREYFTYDPYPNQVWREATTRLRGWRYDASVEGISGQELELDEQGRLWSEELESYLIPDGTKLRLSDREGRLRPTADEMAALEGAARREAEERARSEEAARRKEEAARRKEEAARIQAEQRATEEATARQIAEAWASAEIAARQETERKLAEMQRELDELRRQSPEK